MNIVYYMAKGNLQIYLRLWVLKEGGCPGLSGCAQSNHKSL